jgi:hypothetical protein
VKRDEGCFEGVGLTSVQQAAGTKKANGMAKVTTAGRTTGRARRSVI